jgi:hypothetical protein
MRQGIAIDTSGDLDVALLQDRQFDRPGLVVAVFFPPLFFRPIMFVCVM